MLACDTHRYYSEAHGLLYIVDAADSARLEESREVLHALLRVPDLAGIPVLVFANKQDAPGALSAKQVQGHFELHHIVGAPSSDRDLSVEHSHSGSSQPQHVLGVTALNGDGVEEGIRWLVDAVRASPRALPPGGRGRPMHTARVRPRDRQRALSDRT